MTGKYAIFELHIYCRLIPRTKMLMKREHCVYCMSQLSVNHRQLGIHEYECCVPCSTKYSIGGIWCLGRLVENGENACNYRIPHTSVEDT